MKYNDFKKNIKKEFNENYNEEKKEKSKYDVSIWIKLIPAYAFGLLAIILVLIFTIPHEGNNIYAEYENNINLYSEGVEFRELKKVSGSDIQKYRDYITYKENQARKKRFWEPIVQDNGGAAAPSEAETSAGPKGDTSIETNNQEEGVIESDIAKCDGTYCYYV